MGINKLHLFELYTLPSQLCGSTRICYLCSEMCHIGSASRANFANVSRTELAGLCV
jgi:hypothetical protein